MSIPHNNQSPGVSIVEENVNAPTSYLPLPIDTCPKVPGTPYVIVIDNVPVVASHDAKSFVTPVWILWLGVDPYDVAVREDRATGWFPITIPDTAEDNSGKTA